MYHSHRNLIKLICVIIESVPVDLFYSPLIRFEGICTEQNLLWLCQSLIVVSYRDT